MTTATTEAASTTIADNATTSSTSSTSTATSTSTSMSTSTTSTTTSTSTTSTTTSTSTTTAAPVGPVEVCDRYVAELAGLLTAMAAELESGAAIVGELAAGTMTEGVGAGELAAVSEEFGVLADRFADLGSPPPDAVSVAGLVGESLDLFATAYDLQAQGAETGDGALVDQGTTLLRDGAARLGQVPAAMPDCALAGSVPAPAEFATPEDFDLTVFFRLADSLLGLTGYDGTSPETLTESAQAACRVLLDGGDLRTAIEAAIAASPLAGQPFGADEQQFVLLVVTRGAPLWCPSVITDEEAFRSEVISTIVDVFFDS